MAWKQHGGSNQCISIYTAILIPETSNGGTGWRSTQTRRAHSATLLHFTQPSLPYRSSSDTLVGTIAIFTGKARYTRDLVAYDLVVLYGIECSSILHDVVCDVQPCDFVIHIAICRLYATKFRRVYWALVEMVVCTSGSYATLSFSHLYISFRNFFTKFLQYTVSTQICSRAACDIDDWKCWLP